MAASTSPTFLFTPGAWHSPPSFDLVRAQLANRGFESAAVKLASVGPTDPKTQGMLQDAAAVRAALEPLVDAGKEVVVVCHSYGGVPTANGVEGFNLKDRVAQGKKGGVRMVVYLSSFAIPVGQTMTTGMTDSPTWWNITGDIFTPEDPIDIFYGDVEPALAAKAVSQILPMSYRVTKDVSKFAPWTAGFNMGYIFLEQDKAIDISIQKKMQSQFPANSWTATLNSSHSPFLSMPDKLADVLVQAAASKPSCK